MVTQYGGQGAFFRRFQNPYSYTVKQPDKDVVKRIYDAMQNRQQMEMELNKKRSFLDRTFDTLLLPNYAVAGFAKGVVEGGSPWMNVWEGVKAGNPFGKGFEQGETTFSDVIRATGINPENTLGKIGVGTAGFALDVLLDPTTYLSGGISAVLKGTGRVGTTAKALDNLAKTLPEEILPAGSKLTKMTDNIAEYIIKNSKAGTAITSPEQLAQEAKALSSQYNKLLGIRDWNRITLGVRNLPFGDKLAPKLGVFGKTLDLGEGKLIKNMSDIVGLSRAYQASRNAFYGSRIGSLLSRNSGLKQLAEIDPAKLYEYVGALNAVKGKNLDKFAKQKEINNLGRQMLNLDPATQRKVIEALETPTIWSKVADNLKFAQTEKAQAMRVAYAKEAEAIDEQVKFIRDLRDDATQMSESQLYYARLLSRQLEENNALTLVQRNELAKVNREIDEKLAFKEKISNSDNLSHIARLEDEVREAELKYNRMYETEGDHVAMSKFNEKSFDEINNHFETFVKSVDDINEEIKMLDKNLKDAEKAKEHKKAGTPYKAEVESEYKLIRDELYKDRRTTVGHKQMLVAQLRQEMSILLFGRADMLPRETPEKLLRETVDLLKVGDDMEALNRKLSQTIFVDKELRTAFMANAEEFGVQNAIREYLEKNTDVLYDKMKEIYSHLAKKYGYSDITQVRARIEVLSRQERAGRNSLEETTELNRLLGMVAKRNTELDSLQKLSPSELKKRLADEHFAKVKEELYETIYEQDALTLRHEGILESSGFKPGTRFNLYEAEGDVIKGMAVGSAPKRTVPLTIEEIQAEAPLMRESILYARQKALLSRYASKDALELSGQYKSLRGEYNRLKEALEAQRASGEKLSREDVKEFNRIKQDLFKTREKLKTQTNYQQAVKQTRNLSENEMKLVEKQEELVVELNKDLFPYMKFSELSKKQQNMLTVIAYHNARRVMKTGESVTMVSKEVAKSVQEQTRKVVEAEVLRQNAKLVSEVVDMGQGVRIQQGEDGEILLGTVMRKVEEKKTTTREVVDIELQSDVKTGRAKRVEKRTQIPYTEGTGVYKFEVQLRDGSVIEVDAKDIVGTYVDKKTYDLTVLPAFSKEELEIAQGFVDEAKAKLEKAMAKGKLERSALNRANTQLEDLLASKKSIQQKLTELSTVEEEMNDVLKLAYGNYEELVAKSGDEQIKLDRLARRKERILEALDKDDALEILVKADLGEEGFKNLMRQINWEESKRIALDDMPYEENVKNLIRTLRKQFNDAGLDEVSIGKLKGDQFEAMMERYFPRTLSEEGKVFFNDNPTLAEKYGAVTSDYGFGREWNPYSKNRTIEGTLFEANDYFQSKHGVRVFEENLGQAYINRMIKHTDLMYDAQVMNDLIYKFGHHIGSEGVMDGYKAVANYGAVKNEIANQAREFFKKNIEGMGELTDVQKKQVYDQSLLEAMAHLGFDEKMLKDHALPMIELTPQQVKHLTDMGSSLPRQVNSITVDKLNQSRRLIIERDESNALKMYDKFLTWFKLNQTTIMPSFHVRNKLGNIFQGWLGVGRDVFNPRFQVDAMKASLAYGNPEKLRALRPVVPIDPNGQVHYWDEIFDKALAYGVIDEGFLMKDFASHSYSKGLTGEGSKWGKIDPFNTVEFLPYKVGAKIGTATDNSDRLLQFASLLRQGKSADEASDIVRKYLFDYGDLTDFEKRVMKRVFPYYTWMRKNTPMLMRELVEQPEKFRIVAKGENLIEGGVSPEDRVDRAVLPEFARDWLQLPFNTKDKFGNDQPILSTVNMPYMDISKIFQSPRELFAQSSPLLKVPIELATNWNSFFDSPISGPDDGVIAPKMLHVMSQVAGFNAVKQFVTADTADKKAMSVINTFTGFKMSTINMDMATKRAYEEAYSNQYKMGLMEIIGDGVVKMCNDLTSGKADLSSMAIKLVGQRPDAFNATGVLAPISLDTYESLPDKEKQKYTVTADERYAFNQRAEELAQQAYQESGLIKKFLWTLVDTDKEAKTVVNVNRVIDGDTFVAKEGDNTFNVRLLLVDTPETVHPDKDPEPYGKEASNYTKEMLFGKDVKLYLDEKVTYGRRLAFVELDGEDYNKQLIKGGYARVYEDKENAKYAEQLESYKLEEEKARKNRTGLWGE